MKLLHEGMNRLGVNYVNMVTVAQHTWVLIHESYEGQQIGRFSQLHSQITYPNIQHDRNMERK